MTPRIPTLAPILLLAGSLAGPLGAAECDRDSIAILTDRGKASFTVELADEPDEQARGLMFRPRLPEDAGMFFIYEEPRQARFWMRNTMIPLDMIFIDDTGRVESVAERHDTYSDRTSASQGEVRAVLEINAGLAGRLGIGPGAQAIHPAFREAPQGALCDP